MSKPENPPAFPRTGFGMYGQTDSNEFADTHPQAGMTLRDWFAGQALAGMLANPSLVRWRDDPANQLRPSLDIYEQREALAFKATQLADAMLAERAKTP